LEIWHFADQQVGGPNAPVDGILLEILKNGDEKAVWRHSDGSEKARKTRQKPWVRLRSKDRFSRALNGAQERRQAAAAVVSRAANIGLCRIVGHGFT
jgi:hypothetical protein